MQIANLSSDTQTENISINICILIKEFFTGSHTRLDELRHRESNWPVTRQYWSYTRKFLLLLAPT